MVKKSWSELAYRCPINLSRVVAYAREFESSFPNHVTEENLNQSKEDTFNSRACLDSIITTLIQVLYDRELLKTTEDKILFAWLVDNFGRFIKRLDDEEFNTVVKHDTSAPNNPVGVSRISSYLKTLRITSDSIIYESLLKATNEYDSFKGTKLIKKEPRVFLYILFQILQVTLAVMGGMTREQGGLGKRGTVGTIPTGWQALMSQQGKDLLRKGYEDDTGIKLPEGPEDLDNLDLEEHEVGEHTEEDKHFSEELEDD